MHLASRALTVHKQSLRRRERHRRGVRHNVLPERNTGHLAAHALEARLDVAVDVALFRPLAEADRALVVEVLINKTRSP